MKSTKLMAAAFAVSGSLLAYQSTALAKGPLAVETQSPLILVKETPTELDMKDFPFGLEDGVAENVRMSFEQEFNLPEEDEPFKLKYVLTMPTLDVSKDGDDKVTIKFPSDYNIDMTMAVDGETVELNMEGVAEGQVMTFERDGDRMSYSGAAESFAMTMTSPQAAEEGVDFEVKMGGKGLSITGNGAAEQDWTDMKSLDIDYDYSFDSMTMGLKATGEGAGEEAEALMESGAVNANGLMREGKVAGASEMNDFTFTLLKPMPMEVFVGKLATNVAMPTEPSPKPQDIKYLIAAEDIQLDDTIWGMMDPGEAFPRELKKVVFDLEMQAMMMVSLFDPESIAEAEASGMPPMMPTGVKVNSIAFDGLGLQVDAKGEGTMKGAAPDGSAFLSVKGLKEFVASAQTAGMFGEQEAMMIEGMATQLGKEGDGGELTFDVKTDGGMINVNGAPVAPIPGMQ